MDKSSYTPKEFADYLFMKFNNQRFPNFRVKLCKEDVIQLASTACDLLIESSNSYTQLINHNYITTKEYYKQAKKHLHNKLNQNLDNEHTTERSRFYV